MTDLFQLTQMLIGRRFGSKLVYELGAIYDPTDHERNIISAMRSTPQCLEIMNLP